VGRIVLCFSPLLKFFGLQWPEPQKNTGTTGNTDDLKCLESQNDRWKAETTEMIDELIY
jgi:hypothetical protein